MKGKEFEEICLYRMRELEARGHCTMSRYGVQGSFMKGQPIQEHERADWNRRLSHSPIHAAAIVDEIIARAHGATDSWRPVASLPDFEGVIAPTGQQFIFDAKVCGDASLNLHSSHVAERQLTHMLNRSKFGAVCFMAIHFTERKLAKGTQPAVTWAFPIAYDHPFWLAHDRGEVKRIARGDCEEYATPIVWNALPGGRTPRPDVLAAIRALSDLKAIAAQ